MDLNLSGIEEFHIAYKKFKSCIKSMIVSSIAGCPRQMVESYICNFVAI